MSASAAVPMWIETPGGRVFAWYHRPNGPGMRRAAVLLCDPFGMDRMVLHLTYRHLALRLADAGFAVLRMDYPGTCDSEGTSRESARIEPWLASLDVAAERLREWSGASELVAGGVLLGGTLAVLLTQRRPDIGRMILWAPYLKGRSAVRAGVAATVALSSNPEGEEPSTAMEGDQEALGFLLSRAMIADLHAIDLLRIVPTGAVRRVLLLSRTESSPEPKLAEHLAAKGIAVDLRQEQHDGLDAILQAGGAGNPVRTTEDVAAWLVAEFPDLDPARGTSMPMPGPAEAILEEAGKARIRESAQHIGSGNGIFAILSEPVDLMPCGPGIVFVNAGGNHRPGINRNYTEWARILARRGYRVLRIDLPGLGDSPPADHGSLSDLYREGARHDVVEAAHWLKQRGASAVVCVGLCAGGYQSFQAALADRTIGGVVMMNPLRFNDERLEDYGVLDHTLDRWRRDAAAPFSMRRAARSVLSIARMNFRRFLPWLSKAGRTPGWVRRSFVELANRGVDVCIIYNDNEPTLAYLRNALRPVRQRLESTGRFSLETVGHSDHIYSPLWVQERVMNVLVRHIESLRAPK